MKDRELLSLFKKIATNDISEAEKTKLLEQLKYEDFATFINKLSHIYTLKIALLKKYPELIQEKNNIIIKDAIKLIQEKNQTPACEVAYAAALGYCSIHDIMCNNGTEMPWYGSCWNDWIICLGMALDAYYACELI